MMSLLTDLLATAMLASGVLALAGLGETLAQRVGVFNLGMEGLIAIGAVTAIITVDAVPNPYVGLLASALVGLVFGCMFAGATVLVRANQVLSGLALTFMGTGLAAWVGEPYAGRPAAATFGKVVVPYLSDLPLIGKALFSQNILLYFIFIILPIGLHFLLFKTRHGINMRAVGENPAAADSAGIPVIPIRFFYVALGGAFSGAAGAYLTLAFVPSWTEGMVAGRGWIALALVIFAGYRPYNVVFGALFFGIITSLGFVGQAHNWPVAPALLSMLPYLATVILMVVPGLFSRRVRRFLAAPAALGQPYFRDER